ncbi:MAG: AMP-binding protein, partial [Christensenellaceae bacterium]|nr:AMP-binding protein [Christensenellaceae bacterium]
MKECVEILGRLSSDYSYRNIFSIMCSFDSAIAAEYIDNYDQEQFITYAEYESAAKYAAAAISRRLAGEEGNFVGLKVDNSPNWPILFWGILMAGFKPLLLDARGEPTLSLHLLDQAGAVAIIAEDGADYIGYKKLSPEEILADKTMAGFVPGWADEVALCTSGTTGTAKVFVYDGKAMGHQMENARY